MIWPNEPVLHYEHHFTDRVVRCFKQRPGSIDQLIREAVTANAGGEAIIWQNRRITYRELDRYTDLLAANLNASGIKAGDRLAILLTNRPEFLYSILAAARIGAIAVPINIREQTPGLQYILTHCNAKLLIFDAAIAERLPEPATLPSVRHYYVVGEEISGFTPFETLLQPANSIEAVQTDEEATAIILYTSGTTGRPKGAMLTHLNVCHSVMHYEVCMALDKTDRSILAVPASHVTGVVAILLTMVRAAGCTIMMPQFKARAFLELAQKERLTHTILVPAMYNLCMLEDSFHQFTLEHWRIGGYGGAPMPEATIARIAEKLPGLVLMNAYGATETTSPTTIMPAGKTAGRSDSVGQAVPCANICIMDEQGREVATGEAGEIWIHGPMVVPGYWNNLQATAESFTGGFWRSGDIGSLDSEGYLRVFDRRKDMINRGGYKIYSAEVENVLSFHPAVIESAAIACPDPVLGEKIQVFLRCREGFSDAEDIRRFCAQRLADYKTPDFLVFLAEPLPRNANGKVVKTRLRENQTHRVVSL